MFLTLGLKFNPLNRRKGWGGGGGGGEGGGGGRKGGGGGGGGVNREISIQCPFLFDSNLLSLVSHLDEEALPPQ